jgi:rubrerythrin
MTKTMENLKAAFAGESQANRKYLAYAEKADAEGKPGVAKVFRAAAAAETIHAHAHLRLMKGIGTTEENLKDAIDGETYEFKSMYPDMMKDAEAEGENAILRYFGFANEAEKVHAELYTAALEGDEDVFADADFYICSVCGHTMDGEPTEKCPICGAATKAYKKVEA